MFQVVSQWPVITEPRVRAQNIFVGFVVKKLSTKQDFLRVLGVFHLHNPCTPLPSAIHNHSNNYSLNNTLKIMRGAR